MGALGTVALVLGLLDHLVPKAKAQHEKRRRMRGLSDARSDLARSDRLQTVKVRNINERVALIRGLIKRGGLNPQVRALAVSFLNRRCGGTWCTPEKDSKAEVVAIFDEVRRRVRYTGDPVRRDTFVSPERTLFKYQAGDCDDSTSALGALLESVGFTTRIRVVQTEGYDTFNHVYLVAELPSTGEWIALDPSQNHPAGWEVPRKLVLKMKDFEV